MKRQALTAMIFCGTMAAQAIDYQYLTIEKNDGTAQTLTAVGLNITYKDGKLTATNGSESATLALADISRMFFTNTKDATAIADITTIADDGEATVFDLAGRQVAEGRMHDVKARLRKGVYIIKLNSKTLKVQVK